MESTAEWIGEVKAYGADIDEIDCNGLNALHYAIIFKQAKLVQILLDSGAGNSCMTFAAVIVLYIYIYIYIYICVCVCVYCLYTLICKRNNLNGILPNFVDVILILSATLKYACHHGTFTVFQPWINDFYVPSIPTPIIIVLIKV